MFTVEHLLSMANQAIENGDWSVAITKLETAIEMEPDSSSILYQTGWCMAKAGRFDDAFSRYLLASEIAPEPERWFELGQEFALIGKDACARAANSFGLAVSGNITEIDKKLLAYTKWYPERRRIAKFISERIVSIQSAAQNMPLASPAEPKVFIYWSSGFETAPGVVRACYKHLKKIHNESSIVAIDEDTWRFYVGIPERVLSNVPQNTSHFSEILGIALLARYGGVWINAACLAATDILEFHRGAASNGFFAYERSDEARISSWFMSSSGDNYIARMLFAALNEYWSNCAMQTGLVLHHIFEALYYVDERFSNIWDRRAKISASHLMDLQDSMFEVFDEDEFLAIYQNAAVHKMAYEFKNHLLDPDMLIAHIVRGSAFDNLSIANGRSKDTAVAGHGLHSEPSNEQCLLNPAGRDASAPTSEAEGNEAFASKKWALSLEKYSAVADLKGNPKRGVILKNMLQARLELFPERAGKFDNRKVVYLVDQLKQSISYEVSTELNAPVALSSVAKALAPIAPMWMSCLHRGSNTSPKELDRVLSGANAELPLAEMRELVSSIKDKHDLPWEWWFAAYARLLRLGYAETSYEAKGVAARMVSVCNYADETLIAAARAYLENEEEAPILSCDMPCSKIDLAFSEIVAGKTVSVVGPAVNDLESGTCIDAADVVIRTNFISRPEIFAQRSMLGSRTDISYYNASGYWSRVSDITETLRSTPIKAAVFRTAASRRKVAREVPSILARYAPLSPDIFLGRGYALRHIIYDLSKFGAREVTCFGADFYLSERVHAEGYNERAANVSYGYVLHDPLDTWLFLRRSRRSMNLKVDGILDRILGMSRKDFLRAIGARVNPRLYEDVDIRFRP